MGPRWMNSPCDKITIVIHLENEGKRQREKQIVREERKKEREKERETRIKQKQ